MTLWMMEPASVQTMLNMVVAVQLQTIRLIVTSATKILEDCDGGGKKFKERRKNATPLCVEAYNLLYDGCRLFLNRPLNASLCSSLHTYSRLRTKEMATVFNIVRYCV